MAARRIRAAERVAFFLFRRWSFAPARFRRPTWLASPCAGTTPGSAAGGLAFAVSRVPQLGQTIDSATRRSRVISALQDGQRVAMHVLHQPEDAETGGPEKSFTDHCMEAG